MPISKFQNLHENVYICTNPIHLGLMEFQLDDDKRLCNGPVAQSVEVDDEDDEEDEGGGGGGFSG